MFFQHNTALQPPYSVLVDTNFLSHTVHNKLELLPSLMDCLYATCRPIITSCVMAELEKLGQKYRIALKIARDGNAYNVRIKALMRMIVLWIECSSIGFIWLRRMIEI
jgi:rRNA-processing protein FCF1